MLDKFLAVLTLAILAAFCGILVWFVPDLDLALVALIVVVMAFYDFQRAAFRRNGPQR